VATIMILNLSQSEAVIKATKIYKKTLAANAQ